MLLLLIGGWLSTLSALSESESLSLFESLDDDSDELKTPICELQKVIGKCIMAGYGIDN